MAAPTTLTVTFTGGSGSPATLTIRAGEDQYASVRNIFLAGGFWTVLSTGVNQFVPWGLITSITAQ